MYVHSVKLTNFKSIGDYPKSEIILEPRITAIIGKNESGKSNVLDGLSRIRFRVRNATAFSQDIINRNGSSGKENWYNVVLKPSADDIRFGITEDTTVEITQSGFSATGGILTYYLNEVHPAVEALTTVLSETGTNPLQLSDPDYTSYRTYYRELQEIQKIDIPRRTSAFDFLLARTHRIAADKREMLKLAIETAQSKWQPLIRRLPLFFYRKADKHLRPLYKYEDIEKELKTPTNYPNSLLSDFVRTLGISNEDFLLASKAGTASTQETVRSRIRRLVDSQINKKFHDFYKTEEVYLEIAFNSGNVSFMVQSANGESLSISERSNGLRWYLETFIDASANNISGRNVVYLLDEPGTSLHVNAQQKLLELFRDLTDKGNQVVYTTHSPYMIDLDIEGAHRIRAVVKDDDGYSYIYKTAYDPQIAPQCRKDTLTPIINALGMNLNVTFGPANGKVNIVTEGMSDYIYICTMAKQLGIDTDTYAIIPSVGASNCANICSILHGWGCKYIALFDFDQEGVESGEEHMRKKMSLEYGKQYCYVREITPEDLSKKVYKSQPFMIEDVVMHSEINRYCAETNTSTSLGKPLTAKLMCTAIENGEFTLCDEAVNNFRQLFRRLMLLCNESTS